MIIREFKEKDQRAVEGIFALYWTDPEFLEELLNELKQFLKQTQNNNCSFLLLKKIMRF